MIKAMVIEINLKRQRWLIICSRNPHKFMINDHTKSIRMQLDKLHLQYEHFIIIGDLNSQICEDTMSEFCCVYNLKNLVKDPTCYKNPTNPSSMDLILTNNPRSFQNTFVIETGLSDFHKIPLLF